MKTLIAPKTEVPTYVIDGSEVHTWLELVASVNTFIPHSAWKGGSLDALDDILYGGYGTPDRFVLIWKDSEISRQALGVEATQTYYKNLPEFQQLYKAGQIKTLFEMLVDIFQGHDTIELRLE